MKIGIPDECYELFGSDLNVEYQNSNISVSDPALLKDKNQVVGLQLMPEFVSAAEQDVLVSALSTYYPHLANPRPGQSNQAMYFPPYHHAGLPNWLFPVGSRVQSAFSDPINRQSTLNQMIANVYTPGKGLSPHVDLKRFADGVAILSLHSTLVMDFIAKNHHSLDFAHLGSTFPAVTPDDLILPQHSHLPQFESVDNEDMPILVDSHWIHWVSPTWARLLLIPGSALLLEGDARWNWMHGIRETQMEYWPLVHESGIRWVTFPRRIRSSVTLRTVISD